ncbi:lipopolysaccharide/colanic/teichoic acid biosynthesis glycosyltransferase [Flavobacteriaceae bacterium MAR_2010_105]|nr:lipopolysaccharide/colanic/teichoic acid biosynthesis glycosyltransferase [Flavobacteriaceae bacterium MAR_2010_105]
MISKQQLVLKRGFDLVLSVMALLVLVIPMLILLIMASFDTKQLGLFTQVRVGQHGQGFTIYKIRTFRSSGSSSDPDQVSRLGRFFRTHGWDELPQLVNILLGQMSFVGPRPDVPGFADQLEGEDRIILKVKPGLTGPASLAYAHEEALLAQQADPEAYNREVIWAHKVEINKKYVQSYRFYLDLTFIYRSLSRLI